MSKKWIQPFIKKHDVCLSNFDVPEDGFPCFDAFFTRRLKKDIRPIDAVERTIIFPADGRHLLIEGINNVQDFYIKGQVFELGALVDDDKLGRRYRDGSLVISRLCPVDYHRFHFPINGVAGSGRVVPGGLYSVNPSALRNVPGIFWTNKRVVTEIETEACGIVLAVEVGAAFVGRIIQTYQANETITKGGEKGYFTFGGSTIITLFEPGSVTFSEDLVEQSAKGIELYAWMGDRMATVND